MIKEDEIAKLYKRKQIESASPGQLIVMLYDGAIDFINRGLQVFEEKPMDWIEQFHHHMISCQNIITELTIALDVEKGGEIAENLLRLYEYMNHRLVEANMSKVAEPLYEVKKLLNTLREAWAEVQHTAVPEAGSGEPGSRGLNIQG